MSNLKFISHVLKGLNQYKLAPDPNEDRASLPLTLKMQQGKSQPTVHDVDVSLSFYGPQDVTRLHSNVIARREPLPNARDYEPNYLPFMEFVDPDFPWRLSADTNTLLPWLCLLVVPEHSSVRIEPNPQGPNPVIVLDDVDALDGWALPDLADSSWWAHVQIVEDTPIVDAQGLHQILETHAERVVSRILSPMRLIPHTTYHVCLVPTTKGGQARGMGQALPTQVLDFAWDDQTTALKLPVYDHYQIHTGAQGDFESLVSKLKPGQMENLSSQRQMIVEPDWFTGHRGVFAPPQSPQPDDPPQTIVDIYEALFEMARLMFQATQEPVLTPPLYGSVSAQKTTLTDVIWLRQLNVDPRLRVAAGAGRRVIQQEQEQLVQAAWAQVGPVLQINALLTKMQFARQLSKESYDRLSGLGGGSKISMVQLVAPQLHRVYSNLAPNQTARKAIEDEDPIVAGIIDPAYRGLVRHTSDWMIHQQPLTSTPSAYRAMIGQVVLRPDPDSPDARSGMIPPRLYQGTTPVDYDSSTDRTQIQTDVNGLVNDLSGNLSDAQTQALWAHFVSLEGVYDQIYDEPYQPPGPEDPNIVNTLRPTLLAQLDPEVVAPKVAKERIGLPQGIESSRDVLEPVVIAPVFDTPMFDPLKALDLGFVLPGINGLKDNVIGLLELNYDVIESYMVGLNHEMSRELLWRGVPTDRRATYFRQFFDISSHVPTPNTPAERELLYDISSMSTWDNSDELGTHVRGQGNNDRLVLVMRGELLRRYPDALIYAVPAKWVDIPIDGELVKRRRPDYTNIEQNGVFVSFRAVVEPDVTLLGFDLSLTVALGDPNFAQNNPGYFFVLQEGMSKTRFGLDEGDGQTPDIAGWDELTWDYIDLSDKPYLTATPPDLGGSTVNTPAIWGTGSEVMANILYQPPVLVAIHADDMFVTTT